MEDDAKPRIVITKTAKPRPDSKAVRMKNSRCNYFTASSNSEEVILRFGLQQKGAKQPQILHNIVLSLATARRIKDAMVSLLIKQDQPQVRATTRPIASKESN